jgi:hypothetical protein
MQANAGDAAGIKGAMTINNNQDAQVNHVSNRRQTHTTHNKSATRGEQQIERKITTRQNKQSTNTPTSPNLLT